MTIYTESELIFTINKKGKSKLPYGEDIHEESCSNEEIKILSILWKNGKMGAAYFDFNEKVVSYWNINSKFIITYFRNLFYVICDGFILKTKISINTRKKLI